MIFFSIKKYIKIFLVSLMSLSMLFTPLNYIYSAPGNTNFAGDAAGAVAGTLAACLAGGLGASSTFSAISALLTVPTSDAGNTAQNAATNFKECSLDSLANGLKRALVRHLVDATVTWINSGFKGKPNFSISVKELKEDIQGSLLNEVMSAAGLEGLCTGFDYDLKFAIQAKFVLPKSSNSFNYTPKCTIDDIKKNIREANQDLKNFYSWNNFLAVTTDFENNTPFGVYFELSKKISEEQARREENFARDKVLNNGFLSLRKCDEEAWRQAELKSVEGRIERTLDPDEEEMLWDLHDEISSKNFEDYDGSYNAEQYCPIVTPGTVLSHKLNKALGSEEDALITADEFDEIIAALIGQLLTRLSQDGGVAGFNDGSRYQDEEDESIDSQKNSLIKRYSPEAYDIAIKILESERKTVQRAQGIYNSALSCWNEKEEGLELYRAGGVLGFLEGNFTELSQTSISNVQSYLNSKSSIFSKELDKINQKIGKLKNEKNKAIELQNSITETENYFDLVNVYNSANLEGVDLNIMSREKTVLEDKMNELVNGKITGYTSRGKEKKTGGINLLLKYCQSFDLAETTGNNPNITPSPDHPEKTTAKNLGMENVGDIDVADSYDPTDDIYNYQNDPGEYYNPGDEEVIYQCEGSETIQCMGDLDLAIEGVIENSIDKEKIQVYRVTPENRRTDEGYFMIENSDSKRMNVSISINPEINSPNDHCNENIYGNEKEYIKYREKDSETVLNSFCSLKKGKTYFVRINSTKKGNYIIKTQGDGTKRGSSDGSGGSGGSSDGTSQTQQCVSGNGIVCRGELGNLKISGQKYEDTSGSQETPRIAAGKTDVWTISPENRGSFGNLVFGYLSNEMTVSLSEYYNKDSERSSVEDGCVKVIPGNLYFNTKKVWGQCLVEPNKTYYLRITSPADGDYGIFW